MSGHRYIMSRLSVIGLGGEWREAEGIRFPRQGGGGKNWIIPKTWFYPYRHSILDTWNFLSLPLLPVSGLSCVALHHHIVPSLPTQQGLMMLASSSMRCCTYTKDLTTRFAQNERRNNPRGVPHYYLHLIVWCCQNPKFCMIRVHSHLFPQIFKR
jgi:hypothetical protein